MDSSKKTEKAWKTSDQNEEKYSATYNIAGSSGVTHQSHLHPFYMAQAQHNEYRGNVENPSNLRERPPAHHISAPNYHFSRPPNSFPFAPPNHGFPSLGHMPPPFLPPPPPPFLGGNNLPPPNIPNHFDARPFLRPAVHIPPYQLSRPSPGPHSRPSSVLVLAQDLESLKATLNLSEEEHSKFQLLMNNILDRCNQSDIMFAKKWILEHCQASRTLGKIFQILWGLKQDKKFDTTLRILYLANDLLFHEQKTSSNWIKPELILHLVPLMTEARLLASAQSQKEQLTKLVDLWESQRCLTIEQISLVRFPIKAPETRPLLPGTLPPFPIVPIPSLPFQPPPTVPYYKVPAGALTELCKDFLKPYTPIPIRKAQVVPILPPTAASDLAAALTDFYGGMDASLYQSNQPTPPTPPAEWQTGFLDNWQKEVHNKLFPPTKSASPSRDPSRSTSPLTDSPSQGLSCRPRSYSSQSSSGPRRGRSYSRSSSRSRSYSSRGSSRGRSRSKSPRQSSTYKRSRDYSSRSQSPEDRRCFKH